MKTLTFSNHNGSREGVVFVDDDFQDDPKDFEEGDLKYVETVDGPDWVSSIGTEQMYLKQI